VIPAAILAALLACTGTGTPTSRAVDALRAGDDAAVQAEIAGLPDPLSRDLLRLDLAEAVPSAAVRFCAEITTTALRTQCDQFMGRPHLHSVDR
jgi:hypothetical protein